MNPYKTRRRAGYVFANDDQGAITTPEGIAYSALLVCNGDPAAAARFLRKHGAPEGDATLAILDQQGKEVQQ